MGHYPSVADVADDVSVVLQCDWSLAVWCCRCKSLRLQLLTEQFNDISSAFREWPLVIVVVAAMFPLPSVGLWCVSSGNDGELISPFVATAAPIMVNRSLFTEAVSSSVGRQQLLGSRSLVSPVGSINTSCSVE